MSIYHTHLSRYLILHIHLHHNYSKQFQIEYLCKINDYAYLETNINNNYCRD